MRIRVVTVYVTDQDKARAFYTEKLGFELHDDAPYGPDFRWLTVVSPEDEATELYLAHENRYPGAKAYREAMYAGGVPVLGFSTDDMYALHRRLAANGVTFTSDPAEQEYGGLGAVLDDGCGNLLNLHQGDVGVMRNRRRAQSHRGGRQRRCRTRWIKRLAPESDDVRSPEAQTPQVDVEEGR